MYKTALLKISTDKKLLFKSLNLSFLFLIIFFYFSNFSQFNQILFLNLPIKTKIFTLIEIIIENFKILPIITAFLYIVWIILFFVFNSVFFYLLKQKNKIRNIANSNPNLSLSENYFNKSHSGKLALFSSLFSYLGFGCIACGQTILISIFTFFFSVTTSFLYKAVNVILLIGIVLMFFAIKKDLKQIYLGNQCEI